MLQKLLFININLCFFFIANSQFNATNFGVLQANKYEIGEDIVVLPDNSKVMILNENYNTINSNWIIQKVDASNNVVWFKKFLNSTNAPNNYLSAEALVTLPNGDFIVMGDSLMGDVVTTSWYFFIAKFDAQGQHLFTNYVHHNTSITHSRLSANFDVSSNQIIAISEEAGYIIDTNGQVIEQFTTPNFVQSSTFFDSNTIFTVGGSLPSVLKKYDSSFTLLNTKNLNFFAEKIFSYQNELFISGFKATNIGLRRNLVVAKYDSELNLVWQKEFSVGDFVNTKGIGVLNNIVLTTFEKTECENIDTLNSCKGDKSIGLLTSEVSSGNEVNRYFYEDALFQDQAGLDSGFQCYPNYLHIANNRVYLFGAREGFKRIFSPFYGFIQSETPYQDALLLELTTTVGIDEPFFIKDITLYPNPFNQILSISGIDEYKNFTLYDITGKEMYNSTNESLSIDLGHLENGVYTIVLEVEGEKVTKRVIKTD